MGNEVQRIAETLKILANEYRLQLLCELIDGPKTVGSLHGKVHAITQSAISQHLALLKAFGTVASEKNGQSVTYRIADRRVEALIALLKRQYCDPPRDAQAAGAPMATPPPTVQEEQA